MTLTVNGQTKDSKKISQSAGPSFMFLDSGGKTSHRKEYMKCAQHV